VKATAFDQAALAASFCIQFHMLARPAAGRVTLISAIDGTGRTVSYRKLPEWPVFVLAGLETMIAVSVAPDPSGATAVAQS
jgi:hypothetical protein